MRATDLMVGDIVTVMMHPNFRNVRVAQITRKKIGYLMPKSTHMLYAPLRDVVGVCMNEQSILDVGFRHVSEITLEYAPAVDRSEYGERPKVLHAYNARWSFRYGERMNIGIEYIHELQHAMRMTDYPELADKIAIP